MSMLNIHDEALAKADSGYHEFLLAYSAGERTVYLIVEGRDDPSFYRTHAGHFCPEGWTVRLIPAGNKEKVLRLLTNFDWSRHQNDKLGFIVDRDLSEFGGTTVPVHPALYVTDGYSVENSVVNRDTFMATVEDVLNVQGFTADERRALCAVFDGSVGVFQEGMAVIMAQIVAWREAGMRPVLQNLDPLDFFLVVDGVVSLRSEFVSPESRAAHAASTLGLASSPMIGLQRTEERFRAVQGPTRLTRGKYLMRLFVTLCNQVHEAAPRFCARLAGKPPARAGLGATNAMALVGPRARCPASLQTFLQARSA